MRNSFAFLRARGLFLFCCLLPTLGWAISPYRVVDSTGHVIELQKPARRIITLAPNLTEIAFSIGAGHYVVGVSSFSDFPRAAQSKPVVATYDHVDVERVLKLHPDLVVAWKAEEMMAGLDRLRTFKIPIYVANFNKIQDVAKTMVDLGRLVGKPTHASVVAKRFKQRYTQLRHRYSKRKLVSVFYQISAYPLMTLNDHTSVGQIIKICGGKNIFSNTFSVAPQISISSVLSENPEVILVSSQSVQQKQWMDDWKKFPTLTAVRKHHVFLVSADLLERYSPRMLDGVEEVCRLINQARAK